MLYSFGEKHLNTVWRGSVGLGVFPAAAVFLWRLKMEVCMSCLDNLMRSHLSAGADPV